MTWSEYLFEVVLFIAVWLVWLWITQPKYEDGRYVTIRDRLRKIFKRLFSAGDKPGADDT